MKFSLTAKNNDFYQIETEKSATQRKLFANFVSSRNRFIIPFLGEKKQCCFVGFHSDIPLKKQRLGGIKERINGELVKIVNQKL